MQTLPPLMWGGNVNYLTREKEVNMLEEPDEYVVACDNVSGVCSEGPYGDLERDGVKGTPTRVL